MTRPGIELGSPGPLANTLSIMPMSSTYKQKSPKIKDSSSNNTWTAEVQSVYFTAPANRAEKAKSTTVIICTKLNFKEEIFWFVWLVGLVLWHINLCRLFNAKSIFM